MGNDAEGDLVMIRTITVPSCIKKGFLIMRNNSRSIISKDNNENVYSIKVIICETILLPRKRPLISEKAVLNMASLSI